MKESGQTSIRRRKVAGGFTIVELMVTVVVLAILVMLAGPSFRDAIDRYRVKKTAEDLISSIYFARSEAMRTGAGMAVVPIINNDWNQGWRVVDPLALPTDPPLQESTVPYSMTINTSSGALSVNQWGRSGAATFVVNVNPANPLAARCISLSAGGGIVLGEYGGACPP